MNKLVKGLGLYTLTAQMFLSSVSHGQTYNSQEILSAFEAQEIVVPGEFVFEASSQNTVNSLAASLGDANAELTFFQSSGIGMAKFPLMGKGWVNLNDYLRILEGAPGVSNVEPNYIYQTSRLEFDANDPLIPNQWQIPAINAEKAWAVGLGSKEIVIAIIDDAVAVSHPDIKPNLWVNSKEIPGNGVDDDKNGFIDDVHGWNFANNNNQISPQAQGCGHGTHVAGLAAAAGGNRLGVAGSAPNSKIMVVRVGLDRDRSGCPLVGNIAAAIRYAVDNGANVINMSFGGPGRSALEKKALEYASSKNVLMVIAAGNDGLSNDVEDLSAGAKMRAVAYVRTKDDIHFGYAPSYPAAFSRNISGAISVANLSKTSSGGQGLYPGHASWHLEIINPYFDKNSQLKGKDVRELRKGELPIGTSYGSRTTQIGAPGTNVLSTLAYTKNGRIGSGYGEKTGTSMASPIVAGAAAFLWSHFPSFSNVDVKERLIKSSVVNRSFNNRVSGNAQLDLYAALCGEMFSVKAKGCPNSTTAVPPSSAPTQPSPPKEKRPAPSQPEPQKPEPKKPEPSKPEPKKPKPKSETEQLNDWLRS